MARKSQNNEDSEEEQMEVDAGRNINFDSDEEGGLRIDEEIYIPPPPKPIDKLDVNGPRLIITKIVNENFKSYAGKQVVGPFHKCFSAIVGPNGSGKSNVIDSMLFVFGYRASKIRLKKISGLIHDSKEHSGIKSCNVSVHFQQIVDKAGSDYDVVPNSEFIISRTAFKDSSSFYQLNGKKVQFKEVAKLLRSHGVDLDHNRFLILQGEVEQIALMKPKGQNEHDTGMLEYLEDIIGTARYKEPLEKLSEKVEILTERRVEKLNRLRVVEKEKADLEEPMQEAVAYLKLENTITKLLHQSYHIKRLEVKRELVERETEKESVDKDLSDLVEQMNVVRTEKEEKNTELKEKCKKWDKIQQRKDKATEEYEKIRKKDDALFAELVETNKRRKANMASVKSERAKLEELARVPEKNAKDIEECEKLTEKHVAEREREEAALATLMGGLREKTEPLLKKRTKLETELISLRKNVDEAKATFDIAESELQLHTSVEEKEKAKLEELRESLKMTVEKLTERKQQLASFDAKIPRTRASLQQAQQELDEAKKQEAEVGTRLRTMRVRVEEQRSAMQASRSRNRVLDSLMQQKREGNIPGILGRLGDLGAIDAKYDVAISTACGPLDNIVVDTANTAKTCIAFLRERDIGRATFIPLEKQQRFVEKCNQKISTPENVPRLFDLIRVEDRRVLPAFYYGLQNTLVANDLDQATRIAYGAQRYRVVTLNGELIELSGTMSGGGRTVVKGRMGQSVVRSEPCAADVDKLQRDLDVVYEECNRLKAAQQPLENQVQALSTALNVMTVDKEKYTIEMRALKEQEPGLRSQLKVQEDKAAKAICDPAQIEKLTKAVENARKDMEKAELDAKSITDKVAILNQEIDELSGNRVKIQQTKIANISKAIEKAKAEVIRLQVGIKTAERNTKKTEQHIETLESDVEECKEKLRSLQQEKTDLEQIAKGLMAELSEATEALVERDEAMGSLKEQINALHTRETKMKALKIDLDQKISDFNKALKELKHRVEDYTQRIAALKLRDVPNQAHEELKELTEHETVELDGAVVATNLQHAKERLPSELPNMQLIKDYQEKDALYLRRGAELEAITNERNDLRKTYDTARRRRFEEFIAGFSIITGKLKEMYQMITLGGDAELELVDSLDPFSEGIVFSVRPPKKSWKNISNLSGGEKTLSSLALVFALHHFKPTPLYFMDEIDAALDFKNVSIVGNYIKERTKNAQFIVISLRSNMFELADYLVGIYKTFNCTKCAFVDLGKFYEKHGPPPEAQVANSLKRYASQQQKLLTQQVAPRPRDNNQQSMPVTCPAQLQHERTPTPTTRDATFQLPELDLCPTPTRASNAPTEMSETVQNETEEIVENSPLRKRRKI